MHLWHPQKLTNPPIRKNKQNIYGVKLIESLKTDPLHSFRADAINVWSLSEIYFIYHCHLYKFHSVKFELLRYIIIYIII